MRPESSDSAARTELREMVGAARSFQRTASLPGAHARASLPGPFAQDWRNALVRGELAGAMGRAVELFGLGTEVRGTRSLDRLELPPAICALEAGGQQSPLSDSSLLAPVQLGVSRS